MKIGTVPASAIANDPFTRLDPRLYLGPTDVDLAKADRKVKAAEKALSDAKKHAAKVKEAHAGQSDYHRQNGIVIHQQGDR